MNLSGQHHHGQDYSEVAEEKPELGVFWRAVRDSDTKRCAEKGTCSHSRERRQVQVSDCGGGESGGTETAQHVASTCADPDHR